MEHRSRPLSSPPSHPHFTPPFLSEAMNRPTPPWVVVFAVLVAFSAQVQPAEAQQALEIDFDSGRTILDNEFRSLGAHLVAVDWDSGILYADDDEEPEGIMVFSLKTGEWLRTISTPKGEGPYEFPQGRAGMSLRPGGRLYVSGLLRVIEYGPEGAPIHSWNPEAPMSKRVCTLGDAPAVPTQGGVVRRGPDGTTETVGPVAAKGYLVGGETVAEREAVGFQLRTARIACLDDVAYVALSYDEGPDTVFAYHAGGEERRVPVPLEGAVPGAECQLAAMRGQSGRVVRPAGPCPHWSRGAQLSFDDFGNLVLFGADMLTHGAIIDPETGCHALIHSTTLMSHAPVGIHADSVLVYHNRRIDRIRDGKPVTVAGLGSSPKVSIHPLRRISGEPCPGMLPTVK